MRILHWQQLKMTSVRALTLFTTRTISVPEQKCYESPMKAGESDEIMSHSSASRVDGCYVA